MTQRLLSLLASFFLFSSFILNLFIMIGLLANKPFLNVVYFLEANNPSNNLKYGFSLWSYCQGPYNADGFQSCSNPVAGYDWARTPGFDRMLPTYAKSTALHATFIAMFALFMVALCISFILWLISLPFSICCCVSRFKRNSGGKPLSFTMSMISFFNFIILLVAFIIALELIVNSVKAIYGGSIYWNGHAGNALWMTIGSAIAMFMASVCYLFQSRYGDTEGPIMNSGRSNRIVDMEKSSSKPFEFNHHQPYMDTTTYSPMVGQQLQQQPSIPTLYAQNDPYHTAGSTAATADINSQSAQQQYSVSSMSQQYSPRLQPQYLSHQNFVTHNPNSNSV